MTPLGFTFTLCGYGVGALVFFAAARSRRLATEGIAYLALAGLWGGIIGAKLAEWLLGHPAVVLAAPLAIFDPSYGGRTVIGGVLCGWLAVELAKRKLRITRSTGDLFALALPAGEAVGRIGCFFNGCCYGTRCDLRWAVWQHGAWRHPSQLYMAVSAAVLFAVLWTRRGRLSQEGDLWKAYLILWCGSRFALEFFRDRPIVWAGLSMAQMVCLEVAVSTAVWWAWRRGVRGSARPYDGTRAGAMAAE